jgi:oxazoline/thiazoline dehydrogenase
MGLESKFRLAPDVALEEDGEALFLFLPTVVTNAPLKLPLALKGSLEELRDTAIPSSQLEALITNGVAGEALATRYFYVEYLKRNGFLCEVMSNNEGDLVELIPARRSRAGSLSDSALCKLSRFAYLHREGDTLVLESPLTAHKVVFLDDRLIRLVSVLSHGKAFGEIAHEFPDFDEQTIRKLVETMVSCAFAESPEVGAGLQEDTPPLATWEFHDLLFQARSRMGRHRNPSGGTYRFLETIAPLPVIKPAMSSDVIKLEEPDIDALEKHDVPFTEVIENRMSLREWAEDPIGLSELGELLFRAARIKYAQRDAAHGDVAFSPYPAGGAIRELEIYPLVKHCQGLDRGLYRYNPKEHHLELVCEITADLDALVWRAATAMAKPEAKDSIQVLLLITSRFPRLSWKYQSIAYATTLKSLGCLYQTLYLVATAMRLAPCAIGTGDSDLFAKATGIGYYDEPLIGELVIGRPRE